MPRVNVKVYDTQAGDWIFNKDVDVQTYSDVMNLPEFNHNPSTKYVESTTKQEIFNDPSGLVSRDIQIFASPRKSKAGA